MGQYRRYPQLFGRHGGYRTAFRIDDFCARPQEISVHGTDGRKWRRGGMNLRYAHNELMHGCKPIPNGLWTDFVLASKRIVVLIPCKSLYCAQQGDWRLCNGL
jgi:hypothetical protein